MDARASQIALTPVAQASPQLYTVAIDCRSARYQTRQAGILDIVIYSFLCQVFAYKHVLCRQSVETGSGVLLY